MSNWHESDITANGIKIHYYHTGGDKFPVVFNHGVTDDGLCWTHVTKALEAQYDVIMPDARGHGKSDSGRGDYSPEARAADLAGLIEALRLERPVVGGHSMGADTAEHLAARYPNLTRGIFLEDPPILLPGEPFGDGVQIKSVDDIGKVMAKSMRPFKLLPNFVAVPLARRASPNRAVFCLKNTPAFTPRFSVSCNAVWPWHDCHSRACCTTGACDCGWYRRIATHNRDRRRRRPHAEHLHWSADQ